MRYDLKPVRMAIIKKQKQKQKTKQQQNKQTQTTRNNKHWQGRGVKGRFVHCWWDNSGAKLVQPLWETV